MESVLENKRKKSLFGNVLLYTITFDPWKNPTASTTLAISILVMWMLICLRADNQMNRRAG